jgi:hypothetical protein
MTAYNFEDMRRTHGNAYTEDLEYMNGGLVGTPVIAIIYDWTIRQYRRVKMQPLATHKDRVIPADPDAQLQEEHIYEYDRSEAQYALAQNKAEKDHAAREIFIALMREQGPQTIDQLRKLGRWKGRNAIMRHLQDNMDVYVVWKGKGLTHDRYGLPGQTFDIDSVISNAGSFRARSGKR